MKNTIEKKAHEACVTLIDYITGKPNENDERYEDNTLNGTDNIGTLLLMSNAVGKYDRFKFFNLEENIDILNTKVGIYCLYKEFCKRLSKEKYYNLLKEWDGTETIPKQSNNLSNYEDSNLYDPKFMLHNLDNIKRKNIEFYSELYLIFSIAKRNLDSKNHFNELNSQINIIEKNCNTNSKDIEKINKKFDKEKDSIQKWAKKEAKSEIEKIKSNIYTDFIAILGIFTAITFAIFGGIQAIGSITSNLDISSNNPQNLGNLLICASILGILLYGIITVLFAGINKLTKRTWFLPFILNILVIGALVTMFLVGCVYSFLTKNVWPTNIPPRYILSFWIVIGMIVIILMTLYIHRKFKK